MSYVLKFAAPAFALTLGFVGSLQAAGDPMQKQSQEASQEQNKMATVKGTVEKIEGNELTIKNDQGETIRLHLDKNAFQGKHPKEGDKIQAKIPQGEESYNVITVQRDGQPSSAPKAGKSMQSQSSSQSQTNQGGQFTKTISGEILKVDGNIFYVQDPSGKEIRLRLDQSAEQSGDLKKGDTIEALVTQEKEYHVISAELTQ
ncbi:MAG TPA: hypothetical protein PKK23_02080 [Nitrospirales bacterium]|nr:hypothetical protein [Nitrospiraceae bacterium]HNP27804.1 hypothetical protein [Nitrospirales bacterium]